MRAPRLVLRARDFCINSSAVSVVNGKTFAIPLSSTVRVPRFQLNAIIAMEISSMTSRFGLETRMLAASPLRTSSTNSRRTLNVSAKFSSGTSLTSSHVAPLFGGTVTADFCSQSILPSPLSTSSSSRVKRNVITMVIPFVRGNAREQPPPDLASYLFKNRIVYLGMCLVPAVTELMLAELMYLSYDDDKKPIYLYINSTGTTRGDVELGYDAEAFAVYDAMGYTAAPIYTLCVGNAWGEAALLLAAGVQGNRAALPSATIMMKQPYGRIQGQAIDVEIIRKEVRKVKEELVKLYARHTGQTIEQIEMDIRRPKYLSPTDAVEYGIIDKVLYNERATKDRGVVSDLKKAQLI